MTSGTYPTRQRLSTRDTSVFRSPGVLGTATVVVVGVVVWRLGWGVEAVAASVFAVVAVPLAVIDLREQRLPTALVLPLYPALIGLDGLAAIVTHQGGAWWRSLLAMVVLFAGFGVLAVVSGGGLGAGDVRLAGVLGLVLGWHGWAAVLTGTLLGFLVTGLGGAIVLLRRGRSWRQPIPAGPGLLAATLAVLVVPL